jgi:hypothetical protein
MIIASAGERLPCLCSITRTRDVESIKTTTLATALIEGIMKITLSTPNDALLVPATGTGKAGLSVTRGPTVPDSILTP